MRSNAMKAPETRAPMQSVTIRLDKAEVDFLRSYACEIALPGETPNLSRAARTIISTAKAKARR